MQRSSGQNWYQQIASSPDNWTTGEIKRAIEAGDHRPAVLKAASRHSFLADLVRAAVDPAALQSAQNQRDSRSAEEILADLGFEDQP